MGLIYKKGSGPGNSVAVAIVLSAFVVNIIAAEASLEVLKTHLHAAPHFGKILLIRPIIHTLITMLHENADTQCVVSPEDLLNTKSRRIRNA